MGIVENKNVKGYLLNILRKHWLFFVAFAGMAVYLKLTGSMVSWSGDAGSIWETIKSFYSGNMASSYVLYKGFASVFPYAWFYQMSLAFGVGEFVFVKLYHCLLFAYICTIGFPYLVENLLHIKAKVWRKAVLMLILFWLWKSNHAFDQLMVDLPSLAYFLLLVNSALKIEKYADERNFTHQIGHYVYTGLLLGLNLCVSGQYTAAALCIILFILIRTMSRKTLKVRVKRWIALLCLALMLGGVFGVTAYNNYFEDTVTDPLREKGEQIPTGLDWLNIGYMRLLGVMRSNPGTGLPDLRGLNIAKDIYGDQYKVMYDAMVAGGVPMNMTQYLKLVSQYPLDFMVRYMNHLFLALSPDTGEPSFSHLFIAYTLLFIPFVIFKKRCTSIRRFFSAKILIIFSFLSSVIPVLILNVEMRYVMQIQGLIYAIAILDNTFWDGFKSFGRTISKCYTEKAITRIGQKLFPFTFATYLFFIIFCFIHIASLYESAGIDPKLILFTF